METRIKLDDNTTDVKLFKIQAYLVHPTVGGWTSTLVPEYYITTHEGQLVLKVVFGDETFYNVMTDVDTVAGQFKIKDKLYHYQKYQ